MHKTSRAPELSATLSRLSCWIISSPSPFEHFDDAPPLLLRQRPGLAHAHSVAFARIVRLVVRVEALRALQRLAVPAVLHAVDHRHDHRLVHLRRDHEPFPHLARVGTALGALVRHQFSPSLSASASAASISRVRSNVSQRATSRRTCGIRAVFASCPVAFWKRRLNSSSLNSRSRLASSTSFSSASSPAAIVYFSAPDAFGVGPLGPRSPCAQFVAPQCSLMPRPCAR